MARHTWIENRNESITLDEVIESAIESMEHNFGVEYLNKLYRRAAQILGIPIWEVEIRAIGKSLLA